MKEQLEQIKAKALADLAAAADMPALDAVRVRVLGKKGELTAVLKQMGKLSAEERPVMGQMANAVRAKLEDALEKRRAALDAAALESKLEAEAVDVTIPGKPVEMGHQHPMNRVLQEVKEIFIGMGYQIVDGPEIEEAAYNFTKLNIEEGHPSRDRSDTFYFDDDDSVLLRTQTSPMQIRVMEQQKPPIRIICPGRVYRSDEVDATHSPVFHQMEGLVVDEHVRMSAGDAHQAPVRRGRRRALPPASFPVHGAKLRSRHAVLQVPRHGRDGRSGLLHLPWRGLDRAAGRRYGAPEGARGLRH